MYSPDFWCILKIEGDDPHYRVFGSWASSYLYGSSWRMNSGIIRIEENKEDNTYLFYGSSGSCYQCGKNGYGCHYGSHSDLNQYLTDDRISLMEEDNDWMNMDWIISNGN